MADVSSDSWDGSSANYQDAEHFCSACLIDLNKLGAKKAASLCKLPVKTPDGAVNRRAVQNAAARLNQTQAPPQAIKKAAQELSRIYHSVLKEDPPANVAKKAGGANAMNKAIRQAASRGK